ncbi:hypothetical protein GOBAR_AA17314 [Gossypium barbadense]|uniref:Mediator of RNA polymerase II transcription subunit 8 n=1 Tax=Gossypium barbadense TaxID=3634 RepID=A0A2P5XJ08_GOSBA|nr:hypothetical protein GOBAR_AA17314 [Gossypium barbadense]
MEGMIQDPSQPPSQPPQQNQVVVGAERLNLALQQQLNLESVKARAISLFKAITRIFEEFDAYSRTNTTPKWQDILGQYSMVNLELFNIVDEIKKVSKAFVVHPKNVNADNAPRARIDMITAACESAEKVLADTRKADCFGSRQGPAILPTLEKGQAAKIQEQENLLRTAVNFGEGLRLPADQKLITPSLPLHLVDIMPAADGVQSFADPSGMYMKNTPLMSNNIGSQGSLLQVSH